MCSLEDGWYWANNEIVILDVHWWINIINMNVFSVVFQWSKYWGGAEMEWSPQVHLVRGKKQLLKCEIFNCGEGFASHYKWFHAKNINIFNLR